MARRGSRTSTAGTYPSACRSTPARTGGSQCTSRDEARGLSSALSPLLTPPATRLTALLEACDEGVEGNGWQRHHTHRAPRAHLDGDGRDRLDVGSLEHGDEIIGPEDRVLRADLCALPLQLAIDLADPARPLAQHLPARFAQRTQHDVVGHSAPPRSAETVRLV